jgi:hypothetical protein
MPRRARDNFLSGYGGRRLRRPSGLLVPLGIQLARELDHSLQQAVVRFNLRTGRTHRHRTTKPGRGWPASRPYSAVRLRLYDMAEMVN